MTEPMLETEKSCEFEPVAKNSLNVEQKPKKNRKILRKLTALALLGTATGTAVTALGAVSAWQYLRYQHQHRRPKGLMSQEITTNVYQGLVHRQNEHLTLTTASASFAVLDPLGIIDSLAKEHNIVSEYYDFDVKVLAEVSQKGRYGYLGQMDYQLTITGRVDDGLHDTQNM